MNKSFFLFSALLLFLCSDAQNYRWAQKAGSTQEDFARNIAVDDNGNVYLVGSFQGSIVFPGTGSLASRTLTSAGGKDIYLAKFDCSRNLIWADRIGSSSNELGLYVFLGLKLKQNALYITGAFAGTCIFNTTSGTAQNLASSGNNDAFLARYDTAGAVQWTLKVAGTASDEGMDVVIDNSGDVIFAGMFSGTATFNTTSGTTQSLVSNGALDAYVAKYSSSGVLQWAIKASSTTDDNAASVTVDRMNNIYVCGNLSCCTGGTATFGSLTFNNVSSWGAFIAKVSPTGTWLWVSGMGGAAEETVGRCVVDDSANVYVYGHFNANTIFTSRSPGSPIALTNSGQHDIVLAKLDSAGSLKWVRVLGGTGDDIGWSVNITPDQKLVISGYFTGTANFNNGLTLTSSGSEDGYLCLMDPGTGNSISGFRMGAAGTDHCFATANDNLGNVYFCGGFSNTATFGSTPLASTGGLETFFAKIGTGSILQISAFPSTNVCDSTLLFPVAQQSAVTFQWLRNGSAIVGANDDTLVAKTSGVYRLVITNGCNERDSSQSISVTVTPLSVNAGSDLSICRGDSVQLGGSGAASAYSWSPVTGLVNAGSLTTYARPVSTQQYILTGFNGSCVARDTMTVTVTQIAVDAGSDTSFCMGDSVRLNASVTGSSFYWSPSTFMSDTNTLNPYVNPASTMVYRLTVQAGLCTRSDSLTVSVSNPSANAGSDFSLCLGDSMQLNGMGTGLLKWTPSAGLLDSSIANTWCHTAVSRTYHLIAQLGTCIARDTL